MTPKHYKIAQWATGHTGRHSLKKVIEHPLFDLVAVKTYSDQKAGRDAGDLCGMPATGIFATKDTEEVLAARPDCVLYMPNQYLVSIDDMCRILESGANIVTVVPDFHYPPALDPDVRRRLEEACQRGNTSMYATGPSPGFSTEVFPLTMTALSRRIDLVTIEEFADMSSRNSPELIGQMFGGPLDQMNLSQVRDELGHHLGTSIRQTTDAWGLPVDEIVSTGTVAAATKTTKIGVTTIEAGTVGSWQFDVTGMRNGKPLLTFRCIWYVTRDLDVALQIRDSGWHVLIEGDAPLEIDVRFTKENYPEISPGYNAHICLNAVPNVCEAAPGIRTTVDLPPIIAKFG